MKYFFAVASLIGLATSSFAKDSHPANSLVTYKFIDSQGQTKTFLIWSFAALIIDNKPVFVAREVKADEKATYSDGSVVRFKGENLYLNGHKKDLQPGNYILVKSALKQGFIRTFD